MVILGEFLRSTYRDTAQAFEYDIFTQKLLEDILVKKHPFNWDAFSLAERKFIVTACEHMESTQMSELSIQYSTRLLEGQENKETLTSLKISSTRCSVASMIRNWGRC